MKQKKTMSPALAAEHIDSSPCFNGCSFKVEVKLGYLDKVLPDNLFTGGK